jgi:hypothetical protein
MTLGWFAISGRGASTTFDVGSGAFAAGGCVGVGAGVVAPAGEAAGAGATESRPVDSWLWAQKAARKYVLPKISMKQRIYLRMKSLHAKARCLV